jgi:hypothetical protein
MALRLRRWGVRKAHLLLFCGFYMLWVLERFALGMAPDGQFIRAMRSVFGAAAFVAGAALALGTLTALLPRRRTLHDYLSGTAVYPARDVAALAAEAERGFEPVVRQGSAPGEGRPEGLRKG